MTYAATLFFFDIFPRCGLRFSNTNKPMYWPWFVWYTMIFAACCTLTGIFMEYPCRYSNNCAPNPDPTPFVFMMILIGMFQTYTEQFIDTIAYSVKDRVYGNLSYASSCKFMCCLLAFVYQISF